MVCEKRVLYKSGIYLLVLFSAFDLFITYYAINTIGGFYEVNPFMRPYVGSFVSFALIKFLSLSVFIFVVSVFSEFGVFWPSVTLIWMSVGVYLQLAFHNIITILHL
jgi:hypothetical protein